MTTSSREELKKAILSVDTVYEFDDKNNTKEFLPPAYYIDRLVKVIEPLITKHEVEARKEQIMQDELSLMDFDLDESKTIQWRLDRLSKLQKGIEQ